MKTSAWILSATITLTAAVSSTVAATTYLSTPVQPPQSTPLKQSNLDIASPEPSVQAAPTDFPHQKIQLVDESNQSPDFAEFMKQLRQAVRDRNAKFIRRHVTPATQFGFGRHRTINYLNPENPNSPFWTQLEKTLANGCTNETAVFSCPSSFRQFATVVDKMPTEQQQSAYGESIIVVGETVNVRSQPDPNAAVIAVLSNEVIKLDGETLRSASPETRAETLNPDNPKGWVPVILPNQKRGYVSTQYAYHPLGYRAIFGKQHGKWIMQAFLAGD